MVANYNVGSLGSGSRTGTGAVVLSGITGSAIDTSNTDWIAFSAVITGSATAQVETSFDGGATWVPVYVIKGSDSTTTPTITATGLYFGNSIGANTRINVTAVAGTFAITGGTTDVTNAPNGTPGSVSISGSVAPTPPATFTLGASGSQATTNPTVAKASPGTLYQIDCTNTSASTVYLKLYNKSSAPTVGTDVPLLIFPITAGATLEQDFGPLGKRFNAGIAYALTGAQAVADTTAIAAGVLVSGSYL